MKHLELISLLTPELEKLGYIKVDVNSFTLPMKSFIIVSKVIKEESPPRFDMIFAIIFTQTADPASWKKYGRSDAIIESTWYQLLLNSGESALYLDKLFCYDRHETTAEDIKENLPAIIDLFKSKLIPSFEKWNDIAWLIENFEEEMCSKQIPLYGDVESCLKLIRQQMGLGILSGITSQEQSHVHIIRPIEPKFERQGFRNLYNVLGLMRHQKGRFFSDQYTLSSLEYFIKGFFEAAYPNQLEQHGWPNLIYFDKWLKGHLPGGFDITLNWSALILERNENNDEKALAAFFQFLHVFQTSRFTVMKLIVDDEITPDSINRRIEKNKKLGIKVTFLNGWYIIRWMQLSNSSSIWIDFLDKSDNVLEGEWYLNEQQAKKALTEEFGDLINDWLEEDIAND